MKNFILIVALCVVTSTFAQASFKQGYFIKNNGDKTVCFIKNLDWATSPEVLRYKLSDSGEIQNIKTTKILEFSIDNAIKFKQIETKIDISKNESINLAQQSIFAQVLVEGKATLYYFQNSEGRHYFYSVNNQDIKELIQKEYIENSLVKYNNDYLLKINEDLKCNPTDDFIRIDLKEKVLKKFFVDYNLCKNSESTFVKQNYKIKLGLTVFAGVNSSSLDFERVIVNEFIDDELSFDQKISPTFGIEGEVLLPLNNYKYSLISGLTYRSYKSTAQSEDSNEEYEVDYSSIELNLGARHYMYLNPDSKLFLEASVVIDFLLNGNSKLEFDPFSGIHGGESDDALSPKSNISFGLGYNYKKFGIRLKYFTSRKMFTPQVFDSNYKNIAVHLLYKVL